MCVAAKIDSLYVQLITLLFGTALFGMEKEKSESISDLTIKK